MVKDSWGKEDWENRIGKFKSEELNDDTFTAWVDDVSYFIDQNGNGIFMVLSDREDIIVENIAYSQELVRRIDNKLEELDLNESELFVGDSELLLDRRVLPFEFDGIQLVYVETESVMGKYAEIIDLSKCDKVDDGYGDCEDDFHDRVKQYVKID